jgi:hypothetical protein
VASTRIVHDRFADLDPACTVTVNRNSPAAVGLPVMLAGAPAFNVRPGGSAPSLTENVNGP